MSRRTAALISLAADYFILVLCVCTGVVQVASAYSHLNGLLFIPDSRAGYLIGLALPTGAFTWFVHIGDVGIPGDLGGVEGFQQFGMFLGAAAAATGLSAVVSSLTQYRRKGNPAPGLGMDALREATVLQLVQARLKERRRR